MRSRRCPAHCCDCSDAGTWSASLEGRIGAWAGIASQRSGARHSCTLAGSTLAGSTLSVGGVGSRTFRSSSRLQTPLSSSQCQPFEQFAQHPPETARRAPVAATALPAKIGAATAVGAGDTVHPRMPPKIVPATIHSTNHTRAMLAPYSNRRGVSTCPQIKPRRDTCSTLAPAIGAELVDAVIHTRRLTCIRQASTRRAWRPTETLPVERNYRKPSLGARQPTHFGIGGQRQAQHRFWLTL